jgi:energy-coupling factor transporter ATP-binding protein EcfA2
MIALPAPRRRGYLAAPAVLRMEWAHKSFAAGVPGCRARVHVLRGVKLALRPSEFVAITGAEGTGKTTLLLCAAGLMRAELGIVRWGAEARDPAMREYAIATSMETPHAALLCIDEVDDWDGLALSLAGTLASGAAVLAAGRDPVRAAGRDPVRAAAAGARVLLLRDGRLDPFAGGTVARAAARRVAECDRRSVDPVARRA